MDQSEDEQASEVAEETVTPLFPDAAPTPTEITLSIAYLPDTGDVKLDGNFRGEPDGTMLLKLAQRLIKASYPES